MQIYPTHRDSGREHRFQGVFTGIISAIFFTTSRNSTGKCLVLYKRNLLVQSSLFWSNYHVFFLFLFWRACQHVNWKGEKPKLVDFWKNMLWKLNCVKARSGGEAPLEKVFTDPALEKVSEVCANTRLSCCRCATEQVLNSRVWQNSNVEMVYPSF